MRFCAQKLLAQAFMLICLLGAPSVVVGQVESDVKASQQSVVQIKAWVEPNDGLVVSQQAILYIEVATPDWFSGGTRIAAFEMDDVVVLRREKFSVNSTRRVGVQTWSVQLWSISLYPQTAGQFLIPEIELKVSTASEGKEASAMFVTTQPISFSAIMPAGIKTRLGDQSDALDSWVASTRFQINENYDKPLTDLKVGSSVKRVIEIQSENVAAMMLPALQFASLDGLATYQEPASITDKVNRGDYLATRVETVNYVVEKAGSYRLPQLDFYRWDLNSQSLRHEILAEQFISTTGAANPVLIGAENSIQAEALVENWSLNFKVLFVIAVLLLVFSFWWFKVAKRGAMTLDQTGKPVDLERRYRKSCRQGDFSQAAALFYQWLDSQPERAKLAVAEHSLRHWLCFRNEPEVLKMFDDLMAATHSRTNNRRFEGQRMEPLITEIKRLLLVSAPPSDVPELQLN